MFYLQAYRRCSGQFALLLLSSCSSTDPSHTGPDQGAGGASTDTGGAGAGTGGDAAASGGAGTGGDVAPVGGAGTGGNSASGGGIASGGTGGASATGGVPGAGGEPAENPDLEAFLLEGVGDIERPGPYEYGAYAMGRDDVPHGTVREFDFQETEFYPTHPTRGIKVYEPAQYEEGQEVFLAVFFDGTASWAYLSNNSDGGTYRTLHVLDNLIADELIPPLIGVFIGNDGDGGNRQAELAPIDDKQARFILEAVLPEVSERYGYNFSDDPRKNAIIGESSGGNAAFTVAWNRPDAFHRMQGHSSSFSFGPAAGFPDIVRSTEEMKPLRIHLEGGMGDGPHHANMAAALKEKGYVYQWFNSTDSGHGGPGGDTSFPEGLIWLWRGWDYL